MRSPGLPARARINNIMQLEPKLDLSRVAQDLQVRKVQVESVLRLIDAGNTIPFIARYRQAETGGLDEDTIRRIEAKVAAARRLLERKKTILKSIESQGRLTDELHRAIALADTPQRLDDLYLPFKPKQKSPAAQARNKGLEPVAAAIWQRDPAAADLDTLLPTLVDPEKGLESPEDVLNDLRLLLAERISEIADVRAVVRMTIWRTGTLRCKKSSNARADRAKHYREYFEFSDNLRRIPAHRIMAINRGQREGVLETAIEWDREQAKQKALAELAKHLLGEAARLKASASAASQEARPPSAPPPEPQQQANGADSANATDQPQTQPAPSDVEQPQSAAEEPPAPELPPVEPVETGDPLAQDVDYRTPHAALLQSALELALTDFVYPSLERDVQRELRDEAEEHTLESYARSLKNLLLQRPVSGLRILAIDPAIKHECYIAAIDENGNVLDHAAIHPHYQPKRKKRQKSKGKEKGTAATPKTTPEEAKGGETGSAANPGDGDSPAAASAVDIAAGQDSSTEQSVEQRTSSHEQPTGESASPAPSDENATEADSPSRADAASATPASSEDEIDPEEERRQKREEARRVVEDIVRKHGIQAVIIGDGEGCRETEAFIAELIEQSLSDLRFAIVSEAGASVYSVSKVGKEELPDVEPGVRGAVSIGRRVHDPLAELVKIDPPHLGASQHFLDVNPRQLRLRLEAVVESCVNFVGADANRAESHLLRWIAGFNQLIARDLASFRQQHGMFHSREQLKEVPVIDDNRFRQAAGFLRVDGDNPLDRSWVHPESYELANRILEHAELDLVSLADPEREEERRGKLAAIDVAAVSKDWQVPDVTLRSVIEALVQFGHDPRETLPGPVFRNRLLRLEDLQPGQELQGVISNVVDFGAFVDIGLEESGLVHISELANRFIRNPYDVVTVGDVVTVWVLKVDTEKRRVSLTMIRPGTPRRPERPAKPAEPRERRERPRARPQSEDRRPQRRAEPGRPRQQRSETRPQQRPRPSRPKRQPPPPKLSKEALEGREELRSFAELGAFFAEKLGIGKPPKKKKKPRPPKDKGEVAPATEEAGTGNRAGPSEPETKTTNVDESGQPAQPTAASPSDDLSSPAQPESVPPATPADSSPPEPVAPAEAEPQENAVSESQGSENSESQSADRQVGNNLQRGDHQNSEERLETEPEATPKANP